MDVPFARDAGVVENAYAALGLDRAASDEEVRAAWRRAARETHPDVGGDAVAFRVAREAYEMLIDPERRAAHDRLLDACRAPGSDGAATQGPDSSARASASDTRAGPMPARPHPVARKLEWVLIVANVVVVLRALDVLRGARVLPPWGGMFLFPLPDGGVRVWVMAMDLLGLPWVFLVLAAVATATLVAELVHERCEGTPLLDAEQRSIARALQAVVPAPLALGVALAAVVLALQLVLSLMIATAVLAGLWMLLRVVAE
jgi:hypothetical protein